MTGLVWKLEVLVTSGQPGSSFRPIMVVVLLFGRRGRQDGNRIMAWWFEVRLKFQGLKADQLRV